MKRLIAAVLLLVFAFTLTAATRKAFRKEIYSLSDSILNVIDAVEYGSQSELTAANEALRKQWSKSGKILHALLPHGEMDEAEQNITALREVLEHCDDEEVIKRCIDALNQIKNLKESEKLSFENIF